MKVCWSRADWIPLIENFSILLDKQFFSKCASLACFVVDERKTPCSLEICYIREI